MSSANQAIVLTQPLERLRVIDRHLQERLRTAEIVTRSHEEINNYWGSYLNELKYLRNKPTLFCWLKLVQQPDNTGERSLPSTIIVAAVYEEWYRCYKNDLNIEFGHFAAKPI